MKILFTVQGEGRGHMTQAIAAHEILKRREHQVVAVLAGGNLSRSLPPFFANSFETAVRRIASPGFALSKNRGISIGGSGFEFARSMGAYRESLRMIDRAIAETKPDLIMNFLEPLTGVYNLLKRPSVPTLAVGHQFMSEHPVFLKVKEFPTQRFGMKYYFALTGARSTRLALSFYPAPDWPRKGLMVSPPIFAAASI